MQPTESGKKSLLDKTDLKILKLLQEDSQTPYRKLARILRMSPAAIHKRIKKLKRNGTIRRFTVVLDPQKIGKGLKAFVGIATTAGACASVISSLRERPEVLEIHEIAGEHDLFTKIVTTNTEELNKLLHELDAIPGVASTRTLVVLKTEKETTALPLE
jgi:DNA-binding Lrp family transcriptional regulator